MKSYKTPCTETFLFVSQSIMQDASPATPSGDILGTPSNVGEVLGGGGTGFD